MYQPVIQRSYLTEIKLTNTPAANQRVAFLDVPELSQRKLGALVVGVEAFHAGDLSVSPNGNTVVSTITGMVLTLSEEATETTFQYPCTDLRPAVISGLIRLFNRKKINLSKSYITIFDATGLSINQAVLFNFIYEIPRR